MNLFTFVALGVKGETLDNHTHLWTAEDFDQEEIRQLREMDENQLRALLYFTRVRVYNDIPVLVMTEDEMRMAFVSFRMASMQVARQTFEQKLRRGYVWAERAMRVAHTWSEQ